jgi:hypothetical protein
MGMCHFCGLLRHIMCHCLELVWEMTRRAHECQTWGRLQSSPNYQSNVIIQKVDETKNYSQSPIDLFDVALSAMIFLKKSRLVVGFKCIATCDREWRSFYRFKIPKRISLYQDNWWIMFSSLGERICKPLGANGEIKILDVMYVCRLTKNLLFISCIVDKGFVLVFDDTKCLI